MIVLSGMALAVPVTVAAAPAAAPAVAVVAHEAAKVGQAVQTVSAAADSLASLWSARITR